MKIRIILYICLFVFLINCKCTQNIISKSDPIVNPEKMHKAAYMIFDNNGQVSDYASLLESSLSSEVILFGVLHKNSICHWLQYEIMSDLTSKSSITLGLEMFEKGNQ